MTYPLADPFLVVATQNPVEMEGTYALPEAQRDRFTARISMGYPDPAAELSMVDGHATSDPLDGLEAVSDAREVTAVLAGIREVHMAPELRRYAVELSSATRRMPEVRLGASPRATLHLVRAARAQAALAARDFVVPDDLQAVAPAVLAHRLVLSPESLNARRNPADLIRAVIARLPVPQAPRS
jgi:MoxR-like ATPase